ncbi:putative ABC transport system ATP-binding protein [Tumebacillus sp. BK434]|uniref:ABC transporter ATP-binding protein n=1 Tax=Tumebacillus sp. BK434 TaxID=2512169 RepID=UPI001051642E|nr:ABC transporter ATP-binding protein [Tumebacillus sp. BK434]TCP55750.1 putative ABC transport system ATP-binding protein [Tumebacillus sp. BK434]
MLINAHGLSKKYPMGESVFYALQGVNLAVDQGEIVTILGPSGSGKSTLLNVIGGIERPDGGQLFVDGQKISAHSDAQLTMYRREKIGFVFQFYNLIANLTVQENIEATTHIAKAPLPVDEVLRAVGMYDKRNKFPSELSGGEQQRVSIARAVAKNPGLLLCDEPTGALDFATSKEILKLLENINQTYNTTILIITHNPALQAMSDRILRLRSGEIVEDVANPHKLPAEQVEW